MADDEGGDGCGCGSCLGIVFTIIVLFALIFGVTVNGRHYGMSCSVDRGVEFHTGTPVDPVPPPADTPK